MQRGQSILEAEVTCAEQERAAAHGLLRPRVLALGGAAVVLQLAVGTQYESVLLPVSVVRVGRYCYRCTIAARRLPTM